MFVNPKSRSEFSKIRYTMSLEQLPLCRSGQYISASSWCSANKKNLSLGQHFKPFSFGFGVTHFSAHHIYRAAQIIIWLNLWRADAVYSTRGTKNWKRCAKHHCNPLPHCVCARSQLTKTEPQIYFLIHASKARYPSRQDRLFPLVSHAASFVRTKSWWLGKKNVWRP